jgi:hypothetical protein
MKVQLHDDDPKIAAAIERAFPQLTGAEAAAIVGRARASEHARQLAREQLQRFRLPAAPAQPEGDTP